MADIRKITQAIAYLASKLGNSVERYKIVKLLYIADRYSFRKNLYTVSRDDYFIMSNGPVGSLIADVTKQSDIELTPKELIYVENTIKLDCKNKLSSKVDLYKDLTSSNIEALDFAKENFGHLTKDELITLTHKMPEWTTHEYKLTPSVRRIKISDHDFMEEPENSSIDPFYRLEKKEKTYYKKLME